MKPRGRVIAVIRHEKPDRIPIYGCVHTHLEEEIKKVFGSVGNFADRYEFDYAQLFGGPAVYPEDEITILKKYMDRNQKDMKPSDILDIPMNDPDNEDAYQGLIQQIRHHKEIKERFVYVQVPGFFEFYNGILGFYPQLFAMYGSPREVKELYGRLLKWNISFSMNCLDLGVDMIHVSDDWGSQKGLMIRKDVWGEFIYPYHKKLIEAVKKRNAFVSLHSDGNINDVVEGIVELGYDVVHPWLESAGMSLEEQKRKYSHKFVIMGGLDVKTILGSNDFFKIQTEIDRVLNLFKDGGLLFTTSHFVQPPCTIEELKFAYDYVYRRVRELASQEEDKTSYSS